MQSIFLLTQRKIAKTILALKVGLCHTALLWIAIANVRTKKTKTKSISKFQIQFLLDFT